MQEQEIQVEPEQFLVNVNTNYNDLENKPSINDITLEGNKTLHDLGIQPEGEYVEKEIYNSKIEEIESKNGELSDKLDTTKSTLEKKDTELGEKIDQIDEKNTKLETKVTTIEENYITKDADNLTNYIDEGTINGLLENKADKSKIPTKVSDLRNDTGFITDDNVPKNVSELVNDSKFITKEDVPTKLSELENDSSYVKTNQLPTKTSELNNDSNFITKLVEDLVNYYNKSETYSRGEINDIISALQTVKIKKVDTRPETGETNIIYFVLNKYNPQEENYYDEFMYFEDAWEKIGTTKIDLSDYPTDEALQTLLSNYVKSETFTSEMAKKLSINSSGYVKNISIEGKTITITKGDDSTDSLVTQDTTYTTATPSKEGLMSSEDKSKLDNISIPKKVSDLANDSGYLTEESDPTVPDYVKSIASTDITKWNNKAEKSSIPTKVSDLQNDSGFITEYTETDPTVPSHVKSITTTNISSWNNKAEVSAIPTKVSQLTNDMFVKCASEDEAKTKSAGDTQHLYYWVEE